MKASALNGWAGSESEVTTAVERFSADCLKTYEVDPRRVTEDQRLEQNALETNYGRRQLFELIQNGADELVEGNGRIEVVLTTEAFYCANEGRPLTTAGVGALLGAFNSSKSGVEIGRYGLGFKSILGVSDTPAMFSRSGSFGFDARWNLAMVQRALPSVQEVATLRLARPLDPLAAAADDGVLAELMEWAATVVVAPRQANDTSWLASSMRNFPAEFLLFSSQVSELVLDDRTDGGLRRVMRLEVEGDVSHLTEEGDERGRTSWRVFKTIHAPSAAVRQDAGSLADRDRIPLSWAVPLNRPLPGELWAFFPTLETTTLSGILNAPWKLTADRSRLVEGPFNEELLDVAVQLVLRSIAAASRPDDPGYVLELLPARGRELRGWADEIVSDAIYTEASTTRCLPDQNGVLNTPTSLRVHPDGVPLEAARRWADQPTRPVAWVHPSAVQNPTRRSRVDRLLESAGVQTAHTWDWLEALIPSGDKISGSVGALQVAAAIVGSDEDDAMRKARIVLTDRGDLTYPRSGDVYLSAEIDVELDVELVAPDVANAPGTIEALQALGIVEVDPAEVLTTLIARAVSDQTSLSAGRWQEIWDTAHRLQDAEVEAVLCDRFDLGPSDIHVKTASGPLKLLSTVLLPGHLLHPEDFKASHRGLLVDDAYHRRELPLLWRLGGTDRPLPIGGTLDEPWLQQYRGLLIKQAIDTGRHHGARVREEHFELVPAGGWAGPATPLDGLLEDPAAKYARELLTVNPVLEPWTLRRNKGRVTENEVEHPLLWRVRELGAIWTSRGRASISHCVTDALIDLSSVLPVAELPESACQAFGLPSTVEQLDPPRVELALQSVAELEREDEIGLVYLRLLPAAKQAPDHIRAVVYRDIAWVAPAEVCAAARTDDIQVLRRTGAPFVKVPDEAAAERLVHAWGLKSVADAVTSKIVAVPDGERELVVDAYPLLRLTIGPGVDGLELMPCRELHREVYTEHGSTTQALEFDVSDGLVYYLTRLDEIDQIRRLTERLGQPLERDAIQSVLAHAQAAEVLVLQKGVRDLETDPERLLMLIGIDALRSRIPQDVLDAVEKTDGRLDGLGTASLALNVFGIEILKTYREALSARGFVVPTRWDGRHAAARFTEDLGFPRPYAGFADTRLEETLDVAGPSPLPQLHLFQRRAADAIKTLLSGEKGRRGLLSLPTGAGKTRVAVQALTESMASGSLKSPVLWIAQSEELCEQAVQSWSEVWRAEGPDSGLRISRLWGSHKAERRDDDGNQVVVATISKINHCVDDERYAWLTAPGCVVVDEAHTSTTPSYTALLRWCGIDRSDRHAPLIGLSATPFRGVSVEETERLVARYGRNRLDDGIFSEEASIPLLQHEGILARVEHRVLAGTQNVLLNSSEKQHISTFNQLPPSVLEKLGSDLERTNRLVESILSLDPTWPVLLFATSVSHARTVAALLTRRGRSAAAVSGETPTPVRRHLISDFREGRLLTLTNCNVFTTGFDAPSVRALYVARPTASPNLYQQMIGRGLRGPRNGGKETCLVVDVADNLVAHGFDLAFRDFEYLWDE